jgi:uncharacterized protein YhdP
MRIFKHFSMMRDKAGDKSDVQGDLKTKSLGELLSYFNISSNIQGGASQIGFNLKWHNKPFNLDFPSLAGDMDFKLQQGMIVGLSQATNEKLGLVGLMNILGLQTLPRRLTLNFSDLMKSGYPFDEGGGKFVLRQGSAYTDEVFLKGPSARVSAQGRLGYVNKDYDLELKVVPYVTSSLPVIATIAGGPVAGAVTWVADKVLSREVNRITEHVYKITGTWDKPHYKAINTPTGSTKIKSSGE